jgi:phage terminase large subunit
MSLELAIQTPRVFEPLLQPGRYKGAHGGRGSGKSHFFAELLVEKAILEPGLHAVCIREVQKSLAQSAKRTIELKIQALGVGHLFDVQKAEIKTPGGGLIIFQGMQNHTADSIKSLEGYDVAWVEEAQTLSQHSLRLLRPTLRKAGSELWFSWNPKDRKDPVDDLLRGNSPDSREKGWELPPGAIVVQANWQDNPWFADTTLISEKDFDQRRDKDTYAHVWLGDYARNSEARVFKHWKVEWFDPPPPNTILYGGADWGFSVDPTVLVVCWLDDAARKLYVWREQWALGCAIDQTPRLFDKIDPDWTPQKAVDSKWKSLARRIPIRADSARPETISHMQRNGFPRMTAALKGAGSIEDGIEFLNSYDIVVHPDCRHVADELAAYSFKIDPKTDEVTSILEDKKNHTIDALRYALEGVRRKAPEAIVGTYRGT